MSDPERLREILAGNPLLMTPEEAATVLLIGCTTIWALMKGGDLRPVHIGRSCRITRAELERYVMRIFIRADGTLVWGAELPQRRRAQEAPHRVRTTQIEVWASSTAP